ncbi:MAG: YidC/Oxa1 family membrane protein insertase [Caldilineaceae bacterium]
MKRKHILLLLILVVAAFMLSGCGVPREGVDVMKQDPQGFWQQIIVWPLAKSLIFLNDLLTKANFPFHWGFAIILFTVLVKVITLPLTISQIRGMQAQKDLQPKIQELQKKYKGDREKIAQEQMRLYQEAGVNPLSGCLPLLIQMPILIGLYAALVANSQLLTGSQWFWIPDLSFPHYSEGMKWLTTSFQAGEYLKLVSYLILPILLVASQFWMQKTMTPTSTDPQAQSMQQVSLMMTFMFGFFTLQVPAGLTLYWVTSNLLQMLQQWAFSRSGLTTTTTPATVAVGAGENTPPPTTSSTSAKSTKPSGNKAGNKSKRK